MADRYQFGKPDGKLDWSVGREAFNEMWVWAFDRLRFHRGSGFQLRVRPSTKYGPVRNLKDFGDFVKLRLDNEERDKVLDVRSVLDGFKLSFRRHQVSVDKGELMIANCVSLKGTQYVFGVTDCSWLTRDCVQEVAGIELPHNAHAQRLDPRVKPIPKDKLKMGDLVFIHDDEHVAVWLDDMGGGRVWDTEPHNTTSPNGWPTPTLGTGVQMRPAFGNYYCADITACGRIPEVNGAL